MLLLHGLRVRFMNGGPCLTPYGLGGAVPGWEHRLAAVDSRSGRSVIDVNPSGFRCIGECLGSGVAPRCAAGCQFGRACPVLAKVGSRMRGVFRRCRLGQCVATRLISLVGTGARLVARREIIAVDSRCCGFSRL